MRRISEYLFLWSVGGFLYYEIEIIFRGFSHGSMFVLGGICMVFFEIQTELSGDRDPFWKQLLRCTVFVICMEFMTGIILNKWMRMHVWDYTGLPMELFGQICVPYMLRFVILCALGIPFSGYLMHWFFGRPRPHYRIW